ncbi:hypothetical protein AB2B38_009590 [Balneola sp. MJW-20]|uniref:hypothetical protein n=1 Tax=Gracilimonas aurantiaca TaxID=3234185 RepID=UPI00390ABF85
MDTTIFEDVPVENDTSLITVEYHDIHGVPCRLEYWVWDDICGQSLIYRIQDTDDDLRDKIDTYINNSLKISADGEVTKKENGGYVFRSFNFIVL